MKQLRPHLPPHHPRLHPPPPPPPPHLLASLLRPGGTLDAAVARDDDGELAAVALGDLEALGVEAGQQHLQAHQVLELQVADGGLALAELPDELGEAVADPLPGHKVVLLDPVAHAPGQEGLVAASGGPGS